MSPAARVDELSIRRALQAGMAHHDAGRLAQAEAIYREVLESAPDRPEALALLAEVAFRTGRREEALESLERALRLRPAAANFHNLRGMVLESCGRIEEAERAYRRALAIGPDYAHALFNLGNALYAQGRIDEAIAGYRRAVAARPDYGAARNNLGMALEDAGRLDEAIVAYREAFATGETPQLRANFARCAARGARLPADAGFGALLERALREAWARPADLARAAITLVRADSALRGAIETANRAWPARPSAAELFRDSTPAALSRHALLLALLGSAQVCEAGLERFLTAARHALLELAEGSAANDAGLEFACALARQCFLDDYVFGLAPGESQRAAALAAELAAALAAGTPVAAQRVAIVAAYQPLGTLPCAPALAAKRDWPEPLRAVLAQQVEEPALEREHLERIACLTPIRDEVSRRVRAQYEESPYPRWIACPQREPIAFEEYVHRLFPGVARGTIGPAGEILVAGCGTGQESVDIARQFPAARVLAIDLSRASLAFARRKSGELGIANVEYAQADIVEVGTIGRTFDFISCMGVLHHLADPLAGWRALAGLLRPGGLMQVGLYSERARRALGPARERIAARGYAPSADGIRRCREELLASAEFAPVTSLRDFYGLNECRDLLFHVQEHRYTLPRVGEMAAALGLEWMGLLVDPATRRGHAQRFPGVAPRDELASWDAFEREFPDTFAGMYLFWVRKPSGA